jgi:hypothetical protein
LIQIEALFGLRVILVQRVETGEQIADFLNLILCFLLNSIHILIDFMVFLLHNFFVCLTESWLKIANFLKLETLPFLYLLFEDFDRLLVNHIAHLDLDLFQNFVGRLNSSVVASLSPGGIQVNEIRVEVASFSTVVFNAELLNVFAFVAQRLPTTHATGCKLKASLRLMALLHVVFTGLRHSALRRNKVVLKTNLQLFLEQSHRCVLGIIFFGDFVNI